MCWSYLVQLVSFTALVNFGGSTNRARAKKIIVLFIGCGRYRCLCQHCSLLSISYLSTQSSWCWVVCKSVIIVQNKISFPFNSPFPSLTYGLFCWWLMLNYFMSCLYTFHYLCGIVMYLWYLHFSFIGMCYVLGEDFKGAASSSSLPDLMLVYNPKFWLSLIRVVVFYNPLPLPF